MNKKLRMGMLGGGDGAFIGAVHRLAARLDGEIELVCGAFSSDAQTSLQSGRQLGLEDRRCYASYQDMLSSEQALPESERMEFVSIVTPNFLHFPMTEAAIEAGFAVLCDKPATLNLDEAVKLSGLVDDAELPYALTHTYAGYPMIQEARKRIESGELGKIRKVLVEYVQGWLSQVESEDSKQASWRLDPQRAGISCCMGDIGVHAAHLAEFVTGLEITDVCAHLNTVVESRVLDDDGAVFMKFNNGASGTLIASQVMTGEENNLRLRVYGDKGGLDWHQQEPNTLTLKRSDCSSELLRAGIGSLSESTNQLFRVPAGHPEGYIEAFANLYRDFSQQVRLSQKQSVDSDHEPITKQLGADCALRGMAFIDAVVNSNQNGSVWQKLPSVDALKCTELTASKHAASEHAASRLKTG